MATQAHTPTPWNKEPIGTLSARLQRLESMADYRAGASWAAIIAVDLRHAIRALQSHDALVEILTRAVQAVGPFGNDSRPDWFNDANAVLAMARGDAK